jgi:SHO1 osmosensor
VVYYFFVVAGVFVVIASDSATTYQVAVVGYLAAGLVLTTSSVNGLVYSDNGAKEAAAAGFILLSMVTVCVHGPDISPGTQTDRVLF